MFITVKIIVNKYLSNLMKYNFKVNKLYKKNLKFK